MLTGEVVGYDVDENGSGLREVPDYLIKHPYEIIGNIMYSVSGLLETDLGITDADIASSFALLQTKEQRQLWSIYFQETSKRKGVTIN